MTRVPARVRSCEADVNESTDGEWEPTDGIDDGAAEPAESEPVEEATTEPVAEATAEPAESVTASPEDETETAVEPDPRRPPEAPAAEEQETAGPESREDAQATATPESESGTDGVTQNLGPGDTEMGEGRDPFDRNAAMRTRMQRSLNVLINTIPGEVLVLWAALEGAAELYGLPVWAYTVFLALAAISTPVYVYRSIEKPDEESADSDVRWWQEANVRWQSVSATGAFLVWAYYLGGPFKAAGLQDAAVATVLVLVYPVLIVITPYYGSMILYFLSGPDASEQGDAAVP